MSQGGAHHHGGKKSPANPAATLITPVDPPPQNRIKALLPKGFSVSSNLASPNNSKRRERAILKQKFMYSSQKRLDWPSSSRTRHFQCLGGLEAMTDEQLAF